MRQLSESMRHAGLMLMLCLAASGQVGSMAQGADPRVLEEQARRVRVVEQAAPAVVAIFAAGGNGGGSGVLISPDGYVVTNFHVVQGQGSFMKCGLNDGKTYDSVLVGIDPTGDVAIIKMLGREDFPHATIADSDLVKLGDWTYAMGNPFLLATDFRPTVTYGIVSGVHRYQYPAGTFLEYTDCIQIDTSINPGNSGGPLFNDQGELIGINGRGSFEKRGRVNSGAGYAISINQVMNFLDHLKSGRVVDHATLGATVATGDNGAVYVGSILEQSDAFRRGLRSGDEIVTFGGRSIRSVNQFKNILGIYPKGWKLPIVFRRDGVKQEIAVRLRPLHRAAELTPGNEKPAPGQPKPAEPRPDGEQPKDGTPPKGEAPKLPIPIPGHPPKAEPPAAYKHLFAEKRGYANWYFNEQEQTRVMTGLRQLGDFATLRGNWELGGKTEDGRDVTFKLNESAVALILGADPALWTVEGPLEDKPAGTGGLLPALYQFRRMLTDPKDYFSEFYYFGSEPLDGTGERVDVLITRKGTSESRWYFSKADGRFIGWDTALEEDVDSCNIRIQSYTETAGLRVPATFTIQHGNSAELSITLDRHSLRAM